MVSQLEYLESVLNVDVDSMDPKVAKALPIKPHDQTSNQLLVNERLEDPENKEWVEKAIKDKRAEGVDGILDYLSTLICARNIENLQGRVLLQTSPFNAYDKDKIVAQIYNYARFFEELGIPKSRYCIKVPVTGPASSAALQVYKEKGIRTLGTSLFSVHQAIASSQAKALSISPYYNEVKAHADHSIWPDSDDPATKHTMSHRIVQILKIYKRLYDETGEEQPLLKAASFISAPEGLASGEFRAHHSTISDEVLFELAKRPSALPLSTEPKFVEGKAYANWKIDPKFDAVAAVDPLANDPSKFSFEALWDLTKQDLLANNGALLDKLNEEDLTTKKRLNDALVLFQGGELRSKAVIENVLKSLGA